MRIKMIFFTLFISVFYLVGFGLLIYGIRSARRSTEAASWPTTRGSVTDCSMKESNSGDGGPTYEVKVQYTYSIAGREYTGSRLAFGYTGSSGVKTHNEIYTKLRGSKNVDVRYDPSDPATSTLSFGLHRSIQFILLFAITWLLFVVGFTIIWWVASRSDDVLLKNLITH